MPLVIVISSYVAGSRVGGSLAPYVLAPLRVDPVLIPTTLLGRHPGWGPPGGGAVAVSQIEGMLDGVEANGLFGLCDAVLTGYMANPEQADIAAFAIDRIREARQVAGAAPPRVIVDPIMGDLDVGPYVSAAVAGAITEQLVPRADVIACNLWEFRQLTRSGDAIASPGEVAETARATSRDWLVTSVDFSLHEGQGIGAVLVRDGEATAAATPLLTGHVPRGAGDLLKLRFTGGLVSGEPHAVALARSVGVTEAILRKSQDWSAPELPVAACWPLLANAPEAPLLTL
jgi:pyridoxine kinase